MVTKAKKRKPLDELKGARYLGQHDRVLRAGELAAIGVHSDEDLLWDGSNDHFVPVEKLNAATADYLFTQDEFELV